jgi:excisionase family DNA binding protein
MRKRERVANGGNYLLSLREAAEELALSKRKLQDLIQAGRGPKAIMASGAGFARIRREDLDAYKAQRAI